MNRETEINIRLLERLGWFVAESLPDDHGRIWLECCDSSARSYGLSHLSDYAISLYEEEHGSFEEKIWYFAPQVSTSMGDMEKLLGDSLVDYSLNREVDYKGVIFYDAVVYVLEYDDDEDGYVNASIGYSYNQPIAAFALAEAYLEALEKLEETELNEHDRN